MGPWLAGAVAAAAAAAAAVAAAAAATAAAAVVAAVVATFLSFVSQTLVPNGQPMLLIILGPRKTALILMSLTITMALGRDCFMLELAMREPVQMGLLVSACEKCHENRLERMLIAHANITRSCALRCTGCMETGRLGINRHDFRIETVDGLRRSKKTRYSCCKNPLGHDSQCATSETLAQRNQGAAMATSDASGCRCPSNVVKVAGSNLADHKAVGPEVYAPHKCSV